MPDPLRPIFLLSFRHRDEVAAAAERGGWKAIAARRTDGVERRFAGSGAMIAVVDARGAFAEGLAVTRLLADAVQVNAAALLVLLSRGDVVHLPEVFAAGATHYLASPFGEAEFGQMLRFAARHSERLAGGYQAAAGRAMLIEAEATAWRWRPDQKHVEVSAALARRLGIEAGERPTLAFLLRGLGATGRRVAYDAVRRLLAVRLPTAFAYAVPGEGGVRVAHHIHLDPEGAIVGRVEDFDGPGVTREVRSRDALTGLEDERGISRWIDARLRRIAGEPRCILILLSVSRFDAINDAFGKATGDTVLKAVGRRIERLIGGRRRDRGIARIAGAEFAIALAAPTTLEEARSVAAQAVEAVGRTFATGDRVIALSCRVGIALSGGAEDDAAGLLRRASAALSSAKAADAGAIRVLDSSGEAAGARDVRLEVDLRAALDRDEIDMLFQPQVDVTNGRIVGVEALARWRHPLLGELGARTLFGAAERSDYVVQLSEHVQRKALQVATAWPAALQSLRMAVNVTASDIARAGFAEHFLKLIDASGFARGRLTVEITESGLIEDLEYASSLLAELRTSGCRVAIDDFGTGYSSLAYLKALPLDYLKIDQHLAQDITGSTRDRVIVRGVIEMAKSLGLSIIAEGVETQEQLALLAAEGCNYYQGFLCAPPVDVPTLVRLVAGGR